MRAQIYLSQAAVKTQPRFRTRNEERQGELGEHESDGAEEGEAQAAAEDQRRADYGRRDLAHRELLLAVDITAGELANCRGQR